MTFSMRLNEEEKLLKSYLEIYRHTLRETFKKASLEKMNMMQQL